VSGVRLISGPVPFPLDRLPASLKPLSKAQDSSAASGYLKCVR
jgi:hypothetical protein